VTAFVQQHAIEVCLAAADGEPLGAVRVGPAARALVVGSEGHGIRAAWGMQPHRRVAIPMKDGAESLNAAVAAGILLFELLHVGR